jgi:hypothetical protein
MDPTIVAVTGTLLAGLLGATLPNLLNDRLNQRAEHRKQLAAAILAVLNAAAWTRNKQYLKHVARQAGGQGDSETAREARYDARTALTNAMDALYLYSGDQELLEAAQRLVDACVDLGDADSRDETAIAVAGLAARQAHTALRVTAARILYP